MNEFKSARKPNKSNWRLFFKALGDIRELLSDKNFNPSQKEQDAIISLLQIHVTNIYAKGLTQHED